jgi:peptide/nickel transport system permease protein
VLGYIVRRILASIPVLLGVTLATFGLLHATSGSWVPGLELNPNLTPDDVNRLRRNLGLDDPFYVQYLRWITGLLRADFGHSMIDGSPVIAHIGERLPNTLLLTLSGLILGVAASIPLGVIGARQRGRWADHFFTFVSVIGVSVPSFWLALLMILLFSISFQQWGLPWLPSAGATSSIGGGTVVDRLRHLVMPATALAFLHLAIWSRFVRSSMLEALSQDYVRTARAKGLGERGVTYVHAFRNAILPLVTLLGLEIPALVGGGAIVEIVFAWPGIGRLAVDRALQFDYTMVLGLTTFTAVLVVVGNLLADVLFAVLDPRIRYQHR